MGKSKKLEKFRFKLRAKGRHGTHSPFVYAFVEDVLRNKLSFPDCPSGIAPKEWNLLNATLVFLQPSKLFFGKSESAEVMDLLGQKYGQPAPSLVFDPKEIAEDDDVLIVVDSRHLKEIDSLFHLQVTGSGRLSIYVIQPHVSALPAELCCLVAYPDFKMVLDFWDAALFIQSNDFKEKQFFELK